MDGKTIAIEWATIEALNTYLSVRQLTRLADQIDAALAVREAQARREGQESMREKCAKIAGAASLIPVPGTGDCNHVGQVIYDSNAAKIANDIRALPVE